MTPGRVARLAVLVLLLAPAVLAGAGPAGAAGGVAIAVTTLTPAVGAPGGTLQVAGSVTNRGGAVVHRASIRLRISQGALGSRSELAAVAAGQVTSRDGTVVVQAPIGDLAPGRSETFDLRQALDAVPSLTAFGVYVLGVEIVGTRGDQSGRLAITRTLLPWVPTGSALHPTGFSWLWPLVAAPVRLADGSFADDSLASELAPGGRLDRLLAAGARLDQSGAVTWALDPALVESVADMADGYRIRTPRGGTVAGGGTGLAQRWLADLRSATDGADVLVLPYADVDVAALVRQGMPTDVARARSAGAAVLAQLLPAASTVDDLAWPADGYLNRAGLATLVRSGVGSVVLDGRALPPTIDLSYTPSGHARVPSGAGPVQALLADPGLTDLLADGSRARGDAAALLAGQRVVAETAMIASELPGGGTPRTIVAMPPRRWAPSPVFLDRLVTTGAADWSSPESLRTLATTPPPEVDRSRLRYPASERRAQLPAAYLSSIASLKDSIANFASILTDQTQLVPGLTSSVLRLESAYWRGRDEGAANRQNREQDYLDELRNKVSVQGGSFTFGSRSGTIPVTVVNQLPQTVVVDLRLEPQTPRLTLDPVRTRPIGPNQKVQIEVKAHAVAGGPVSVAATLHTPSGAQYGSTVTQLQVNVTQIGTVALVITLGAAAVLFLAAGFRVVRRVRSSGTAPDHGAEGDGADTPAGVHA